MDTGGGEIERGSESVSLVNRDGRKASCRKSKKDDCGLALQFCLPHVSGAGERQARQEG